MLALSRTSPKFLLSSSSPSSSSGLSFRFSSTINNFKQQITTTKKTYPRATKYLTRVGFVWKVFRLGVASYTIYQIGYTSGISEFASDPRRKEKEIASMLVQAQAWESDEDGKVKRPALLPRRSPVHQKVESVGTRIVSGARMLVEAKIASREAALDTKKHKSGRELTYFETKQISEELLVWRDKLRMCKGEWQYIVIQNPQPNAFVSDLAPRKIFVNSGLVESISCTDDELGLVLGHEISHLLHGHTTHANEFRFYLSMAQIVFLSLVPIDFISPFIIYLSTNFETFKVAEHSRHNETEADETGLKIAALGCFDTHKGPHVFKKLGQYSGRSSKSWKDTHPMPLDREEALLEMAKVINCDNARRCHGVLENFRDAWRGRAEHPGHTVEKKGK